MLTNQVKKRIETSGIILCIIGIVLICQPLTFRLYQYGFQVLLIGGAIYMINGYLKIGASNKKNISIALTFFGVLCFFILLANLVIPLFY